MKLLNFYNIARIVIVKQSERDLTTTSPTALWRFYVLFINLNCISTHRCSVVLTFRARCSAQFWGAERSRLFSNPNGLSPKHNARGRSFRCCVKLEVVTLPSPAPSVDKNLPRLKNMTQKLAITFNCDLTEIIHCRLLLTFCFLPTETRSRNDIKISILISRERLSDSMGFPSDARERGTMALIRPICVM